MTIKELLLQEIDNTPSELLEDVLGFLQSLKTAPQKPPVSYQELLERIDYLEAIVGIRKGLDGEHPNFAKIDREKKFAINTRE